MGKGSRSAAGKGAGVVSVFVCMDGGDPGGGRFRGKEEGTSLSTVWKLEFFWGVVRGLALVAVRWARTS